MDRIGYILGSVGRNWMAGFWLFLVAYFAYHAFQGDNSIHALRNLQLQEQELTALAEQVQQQRQYMEQKTAALSRNAMDPDMLEEQVRAKLGFTHPDEVILMLQ